MIRLLPALAILALAACERPPAPPPPAPSVVASDRIAISEPRIRETPQGRDVTAGYLTLRALAGADALIAASSPRARVVELHAHIQTDGGMKTMRRIERVEIAAGSTVLLTPGGLHLMLIGVDPALKPGERVPLTLTFEQAGTISFDAPVVENPAGAPTAGDGEEGHAH